MTRSGLAVHDTRQGGFSILEVMIAIVIMTAVSGAVLQGVLGLTEVSNVVTNRTDMHNRVRNATELLTQEVGQAGRISLPGGLTIPGGAAILTPSVTLATTGGGAATEGLFVGERLVIDTGANQETATIAAIDPGTATVTFAAPLSKAHNANATVSALGGFAAGVIPPAPGFPNGSTGSVLKIFGDINDDGRLVYVEYTCDLVQGRLFRNAMPFESANKPVPTVEEILIDNIEPNPPNINGAVIPCFTYQTKAVAGTTFVVDVAITLTVRSQRRDRNTGDFQRETKALLNVSPRNVFSVWQMSGLGITDRVQPTPPSVLALLP